MSVEPGVLDANVLAYAVNADAPQHAVSRALLDAASDSSIKLYVTSQILCNFIRSSLTRAESPSFLLVRKHCSSFRPYWLFLAFTCCRRRPAWSQDGWSFSGATPSPEG